MELAHGGRNTRRKYHRQRGLAAGHHPRSDGRVGAQQHLLLVSRTFERPATDTGFAVFGPGGCSRTHQCYTTNDPLWPMSPQRPDSVFCLPKAALQDMSLHTQTPGMNRTFCNGTTTPKCLKQMYNIHYRAPANTATKLDLPAFSTSRPATRTWRSLKRSWRRPLSGKHCRWFPPIEPSMIKARGGARKQILIVSISWAWPAGCLSPSISPQVSRKSNSFLFRLI